MRGTLDSPCPTGHYKGIIPAYAGNTSTGVSGKRPDRDHPRVCGEHDYPHGAFVEFLGSSPRMRGTLELDYVHVGRRGIIPAYAGNTQLVKKSMMENGDHPRVCGEHDDMPLHCDELTGSSPRMRGTRIQACSRPSRHGIIPAYAGNTRCLRNMVPFIRDHPRVCGEHMGDYIGGDYAGGSSPRMRGTPVNPSVSGCEAGIIPAYAGNTQLSFPIEIVCGDHPRVCGEHHGKIHTPVTGRGSSPRMRGTRGIFPVWAVCPGIIPAYAGNTARSCRPMLSVGDHPRVCGEHILAGRGAIRPRGSSPRMRGTLGGHCLRFVPFGIIPAYAGNTTLLTSRTFATWDHPRVCGEHCVPTCA